MKVGIVVPYSWSFWGGVVERAEAQARALGARGIETRTLIGLDPPGSFSRLLHPRRGRAGPPPPGVIPLGRSVIVPGNGALSNLVLGPATLPRLRRRSPVSASTSCTCTSRSHRGSPRPRSRSTRGPSSPPSTPPAPQPGGRSRCASSASCSTASTC